MMITPEERLAAIAGRISPCPAPDVLAGYDQCQHGTTWPCPATEAAWLARGSDRDAELRAFTAAVAREAASQYEEETLEEYLAAEAAGAELDCWAGPAAEAACQAGWAAEPEAGQ
jgi:hypothetical protein